MNKIKFIDKTGKYCQDLGILVEDAQPDCEEKLFEFVFKRLVQYSRRKFSIPVDKAEDIANEAILKFLGRLESSKPLKINDGSHFVAYLMRIAYHVRVNEIAKELSNEQQVEATEINTLDLIIKGAIFDLQVLTKEAWAIIGSKLAPPQAKILELFYLEGLSISEIAKIVELTNRQVKFQKKRALLTVKKKLDSF